jgi:hypothetical protein
MFATKRHAREASETAETAERAEPFLSEEKPDDSASSACSAVFRRDKAAARGERLGETAIALSVAR